MSSRNKFVNRGSRSGVAIGSRALIEEDPGLEQYDSVFAQARAAKTSEQQVSSEDDHSKEEASVPAKKTRFSLPGQDVAAAAAPDSDAVNAGRLLSKFANSGGVRPSMSPSALSTVSTAAASEADEEEEDEELARGAGDHEEEEEHVVSQGGGASEQPSLLDGAAAADDSFAAPPPQDDSFPMPDDDDDDDLVPPPPAEDEPEEEEAEEQEETTEFPTGVDLEDDFDNDDKEGTNYSMVDDTAMDDTVPGEDDEESEQPEPKKKAASKKKKASTKKKKTASKKRSRVNETLDDSDDDEQPQPKKRRATKKKKKPHYNFSPKGMQSGPLEFEAVPVTDLKQAAPTPGLRRSVRARMAPLQFWKGETYQWVANDMPNCPDSLANMPVPAFVNKAKPTPYKERKQPAVAHAANGKKKGKGNKKNVSFDESVAVERAPSPFDDSKLRKKYEYLDESATVWDDTIDSPAKLKVVSRNSNTTYRALPVGETRKKSEGKAVGKAGSAFNVLGDKHGDYVGYIMGGLSLPPRAIKDAESVGACAQTFTVVTCQDGALEVAYGDPDEVDGTLNPDTAHRFLLATRDVFRIPPGNCYRLQNHSKSAEAFCTWTIIRSVETNGADQEDNSASSRSEEQHNNETVASGSTSSRSRRSRRR